MLMARAEQYDLPIRDLRDVEAIEQTPIEQRIFSWNLNDSSRTAALPTSAGSTRWSWAIGATMSCSFVLETIPERAAAPKEITILDRMPLTDVGKPAKPLLRRDAAQRAFRTALMDAVGDARLYVDVIPDAATGTKAVVTVAAEAGARADMERRIRALMASYATAYTIEWSD
jgi:hypothetical protein